MMVFKTSVAFSRPILTQVDQVATRRGISRSDVVRNAVADYLEGPINRVSFHRLVTLSEFNQLVLDIVLDENAPDRREGIIRLVAERMEQFHGAR